MDPQRSPADNLGAELRRWRTLRGLTQNGLGAAIHHSGALIGKVEKAERTATLSLCEAVDAALDTGGALARLWTAAPAAESAGSARDTVSEVWLGPLRRAVDGLDVPDDGPARCSRDLAREVGRMNEHRLQARYTDLAAGVPALIAELARAQQHATDERARSEIAAMTTLALRAADGLAFKSGYIDLSGRLIDLMWGRALISGDPALLAAVAYVRTETFFASGDLTTAHRALVTAIDRVPTATFTPGTAAALGALHMRSAVVAARSGHGDTAAEHLALARRAAQDAPEGVYQGTAFGPASLRIHELAVAVELHDPAGIERASRWEPPTQLPAERRSHYYIELSRAQLDLGHHDDARRCLQTARRVAPQHTREHPQVHRTLSALLAHRRSAPGLVDLAAWAGTR